MEAAYSGCAAAIRELVLNPRIDFTCTNDANRTATWFLMNGPQELYSGLSINAGDHSSVAELFLEFEPDKLFINEIDIQGNTPLLLLACQSNHLAIRRILELKADFNYQSWADGLSAFHEATTGSSSKVLDELLAASLTEDTFDCKDSDHATPLSFAAGNPKSFKYFADDSMARTRYKMVRMLLDRGAKIDSITLKQGRTPLMFAAHQGWDNVVDLLLDSCAAANIRDKDYARALSLAVENGHFATVRRLLEANAVYDTKDKIGATVVILAAKHGHLSLLRLFVDSYTNGRTALSHAAENGHATVVHYLLERLQVSEVKLVDALDRQDQTALVWACKRGHCFIIRLLVDSGADPRRKDRNGRMPLSHAAENGQTNVLRQLMMEESKESLVEVLDWKDDPGRTALSWAAKEGRVEVVRALLHWGADHLSGDKKKQTPRMFALDKGHTKVAKILASHRAPGVPASNSAEGASR